MAIHDTTFSALVTTDQRAAELLDLAAAEGIELPLSIDLILWLEDRGHVVDLHTGRASLPHVGTPTATGKAINHLLTPSMPVQSEFAVALMEAASPYLVGVIHAEKGELPDPTFYDWDGDRAEYMQGHAETMEEIDRQRVAARPQCSPKRVLTDAEIDAEFYDLQEEMVDRMFHASGAW